MHLHYSHIEFTGRGGWQYYASRFHYLGEPFAICALSVFGPFSFSLSLFSAGFYSWKHFKFWWQNWLGVYRTWLGHRRDLTLLLVLYEKSVSFSFSPTLPSTSASCKDWISTGMFTCARQARIYTWHSMCEPPPPLSLFPIPSFLSFAAHAGTCGPFVFETAEFHRATRNRSCWDCHKRKERERKRKSGGGIYTRGMFRAQDTFGRNLAALVCTVNACVQAITCLQLFMKFNAVARNMHFQPKYNTTF